MSTLTRVTAVLLIACGLFSVAEDAAAREKLSINAGDLACNRWCNAHRSGIEQAKCNDACGLYWMCNGSNATRYTCNLAKSNQ